MTIIDNLKMGRLNITRAVSEKFYLFPTLSILGGEYIEIANLGTRSVSNGKETEFGILAPKGLKILREEHLREYGGLDNILRDIYSGNLDKFIHKKS